MHRQSITATALKSHLHRSSVPFPNLYEVDGNNKYRIVTVPIWFLVPRRSGMLTPTPTLEAHIECFLSRIIDEDNDSIYF